MKISVRTPRKPADRQPAWYVLSSDPEQTLFATYSRPFCAFNPNMYTYSRAIISTETLHDHIKVYDPSEAIQFYIRPRNREWIPISGPNTGGHCGPAHFRA